MKTIQLLIFSLFTSALAFAQEPADALRYSYLTNPGGTARNQAIGGAGASLGGEFSSLFINPAGIGFYKTGDFVITPSYAIKNNKSSYFGEDNAVRKNDFNLGASGFIVSLPSQNGKVKSTSVGIGVNRLADFNNEIFYSGVNSQSSYSEKYLEELINDNATDPNKALTDYPYGSSLALGTWLISPTYNSDSSQVTGYRSQADPAFGLNQQNTISTTGGITEVSIGVGVNVEDKWYFGGSISAPFLRYRRDGYFRESDASGDAQNDFNFFEARESLETKGIGINGKFGAIYKPAEMVRLGLAVHTPTFYQLTDNFATSVATDLEGYGGSGIKEYSSTDLTNGQPLESTYNFSTPWKFIASGSYVFREIADVTQQRGFVTADIEYVNYKGANFRAADNDQAARDYYETLSGTIDNLYKNAVNVRVGGELKYNTFMFRLGGAYYGNPYVDQKADVVKLSGGIGYRNKGFFVDLTYVQSMTKDVNFPYYLGDKTNVPAQFKNNAGNVIATIGFKI